jgi:hypothetical protein
MQVSTFFEIRFVVHVANPDGHIVLGSASTTALRQEKTGDPVKPV